MLVLGVCFLLLGFRLWGLGVLESRLIRVLESRFLRVLESRFLGVLESRFLNLSSSARGLKCKVLLVGAFFDDA